MTDSGSLDPAQAANVSKAIAVLTAWIGQPELSFSKGVVVACSRQAKASPCFLAS